MSKRDKRPSKTDLSKIIAQATFNPRVDGPLAIIVEMNDPNYCELKAIELITEARRGLFSQELTYYHERVTQAMGLLALARIQREQLQAESQKRSGIQDQGGSNSVPKNP